MTALYLSQSQPSQACGTDSNRTGFINQIDQSPYRRPLPHFLPSSPLSSQPWPQEQLRLVPKRQQQRQTWMDPKNKII